MPEPMTGTSNTGYKIRVADINDEESVDCSELFTLLPSEETSSAGEVGGPALVVTSPMDGDMAEACMEYTVEVRLYIFVLKQTNKKNTKYSRKQYQQYSRSAVDTSCVTHVHYIRTNSGWMWKKRDVH